MAERKKLKDILLNSDRGALEKSLGDALAGGGARRTVPRDDYRCRVLSGELFASRSGKLGYKVALIIADGPFVGRRLWHDLYLSSDAAIRVSLPDLAQLIPDLEQLSPAEIVDRLSEPLPRGLVVVAKVVVNRDDDEGEINKVRGMRLVGIEPEEIDPYAPGGDDEIDRESGQSEGEVPF